MSGDSDPAPKKQSIPPCTMFVDKEGRWFHRGAPIVHRDLIGLFYRNLHLDERGRYLIKLEDQVCRLEVEDTPFVIVRTDFMAGPSPGQRDRFVLQLVDGTREELAPETLWVGREDVLYCRIRRGEFKARFLRRSYYQLARYIEEDAETGRFFLLLNNKKNYIPEKSAS